jgi:SAM-dependent methyltransferase
LPSNLCSRKATFSAAGYAAFRPQYPQKIFSTVLSYHEGPKSFLLDLGCGHGLISRELSPSFTRILATDPSAVMIAQAQSSTPSDSNITFREASAEDLSDVEDGSLDMVVAGQAAHWFDYSKMWPELKKKVRSRGTVAFWGYKDNLFVDYPTATRILDHYCYGPETMGKFWEQPGRNILRDRYKAIVPPPEDWQDIERIEYEPATSGSGSGKGTVLMHKKAKLGEIEGYVRTFSAYHNWMAQHTEEKAKKDGGEGDIVDEMFEKILEAEPEWKAQGENWRDIEVENEWGTVILLARNK